MFFASVALIAVTLSAVARRPLGRLVERRFARVGILWAALGLHLLFVPPPLRPVLSAAPIAGLPAVGGMLWLTSLSLLLVFAWLNRRVPGVALIGLGLLLNGAVIASNGGQMPVDSGQLASKGILERMVRAEEAGEWSTFTVMKTTTRLTLLGDWLPMPLPLVGPEIMSPGDMVIAAGVLWFFLCDHPRAVCRQPVASRRAG